VKRLRAALILLTRLPISGEGLDASHFRASSALHPLVGVLVGGIAAFAYVVGSAIEHVVGALFAVAASALVTGAMHEDGLADCADAFLGTQDPEKTREILKDPRLGTFGAVALFVVLGLRVALLPTTLEHAMAALVLAASLGRLAMLVVVRLLPYAGTEATQKTGAIEAPTPLGFALAALAPLGVAVLAALDGRVTPFGVVGAFVGACVVPLGTARMAKARLGGWVGDVLGATEQLAECSALFFLAVLGTT
jgi:adenosylcobinamide-GDP ribazoletransferase